MPLHHLAIICLFVCFPVCLSAFLFLLVTSDTLTVTITAIVDLFSHSIPLIPSLPLLSPPLSGQIVQTTNDTGGHSPWITGQVTFSLSLSLSLSPNVQPYRTVQ